MVPARRLLEGFDSGRDATAGGGSKGSPIDDLDSWIPAQHARHAHQTNMTTNMTNMTKKPGLPCGAPAATRWLLGGLLMLSASLAAADDPVAAAIRAADAWRAEHDARTSAELTPLAGPAELVTLEPDFRKLHGHRGPVAPAFDAAAVKECLRRAEACDALPRKPPLRAGIITLGISGIRVEALAGAAAFPVVGLEEGAPAKDLVRPGDVIVGANGRLLPTDDDPRVAMGYALAEAQTATLEGRLTLQIVRDGAPVNVAVPLGVGAGYGPDWPQGSEFCRGILERAIDFLVERAPDVAEGFGFKTQTYGNVLLLMTTDDDEALDLARRMLAGTLPPRKVVKLRDGELAAWFRSYELIALAEYYLLTGDSTVLPAIENRAQVIAAGQATSGSWGHGLPCRGYGEVNQVGAACFLGLALARECGVSFDRDALARAITFFAKYAGGTVPYGNHALEFRRGNNGCLSIVAVTFDLLGARALAERFARYDAYTYRYRQVGHAENVFSHSWGPIAARCAPPEERRLFMDNTLWLFELERTPWGGLWQLDKRALGTLTATTGPIGLFLGQAEPRLRILGAPPSVFGREPPTEAARQAANHYRAKDWAAFKTAAEVCLADGADPAGRDHARRLLAAHARLEQHAAAVVALAEANIAAKRLHKARQQIECLEAMLGGERPETAAVKRQFGTEEARAILAAAPPAPPDLPTRVEEPLPPREQQPQVAAPQAAVAAAPPGPFQADPGDIVARSLRGRSPEEIARCFSHPYFHGFTGVAKALAAHGEAALPIVQKLVASQHPALRRGGVMTVQYLCADPAAQASATPPDAVGVVEPDRAVAIIEPLTDDPDELVQTAVVATLARCGDTPSSRRMLITLAGSRHAAAQAAAVWLAATQGVDPETRVRVSIAYGTSFPERNTAALWEKSHSMLLQAKQDAAPAIPALAVYFSDHAYRIIGMFSDGATSHAMGVIDAHLDDDAVLGVVPGLCRTYVRLNDSSYKGWVQCRTMLEETLGKLAPRARSQIAAAIRAEREYLASVNDEELSRRNPHATREVMTKRLAELEALLDTSAG